MVHFGRPDTHRTLIRSDDMRGQYIDSRARRRHPSIPMCVAWHLAIISDLSAAGTILLPLGHKHELVSSGLENRSTGVRHQAPRLCGEASLVEWRVVALSSLTF